MPKINTKKLMEAITGLEAFKPAIEETKGVKYLYDRLYTPMASGDPVLISRIDFSAFTLDDVGELAEYYNEVIRGHSQSTCHLADTLRKLPPVSSKMGYI